LKNENEFEVYLDGGGPFTQSRIEQSSQIYCPLMSVPMWRQKGTILLLLQNNYFASLFLHFLKMVKVFLKNENEFKVYLDGGGPLTQSRIEQSDQMYCPLTSVSGGKVAAKSDDFAPSSIVTCLLSEKRNLVPRVGILEKS